MITYCVFISIKSFFMTTRIKIKVMLSWRSVKDSLMSQAFTITELAQLLARHRMIKKVCDTVQCTNLELNRIFNHSVCTFSEDSFLSCYNKKQLSVQLPSASVYTLQAVLIVLMKWTLCSLVNSQQWWPLQT